MKRRIGNCPACAAPIEFKLSTALVTVCEFCHTVVARADKRLEDLGKVADLVETDSPIQRGMTGILEKKGFEVVGRVQYQHPAGGVWDEWYLRFPGEKVGWLAEAQGKFYLTTERRLKEQAALPEFDSVSAGDQVDLGSEKNFVVAEKGIATAKSADGTIPWAFRALAEHRFVDLNGPGAAFATIEYAESGPRLFLGREIALDDLHLKGKGWETQAYAAPNTGALQINCPQCGGPLTLHVPDQTLRVCCPSCHSLLDCQQGKLQYLETLRVKFEKPLIPLGSVGKLFDCEYTVIGFMVRFAMYEGKVYPWTEYLLYQQTKGFRWLVANKGHWSFVEPLSAAAVSDMKGREATYDGQVFKLYDKGAAHVRYVAGEFYWRVTEGETVQTADYIAPPRMLSSERIQAENRHELNISLGTYVEKEVIETAFGLDELPTAWEVGTIQPKPDYADIWTLWMGFGALLLVLDALFLLLNYSFDQFYFLVALGVVSAWPILLLILNYQFEVNRWRDSDYSPYAQAESE